MGIVWDPFSPELNGQMTPNPLVAAQPIEGGAILIDSATGECFELNRVGAEIWAMLAAGDPTEQVVAALADRYHLTVELMRSDVRRLLEDLAEQGLLAASLG